MFDTHSINFEKSGGLLPAIIQDQLTGKVLMLGYMNREALEETLQTGKVWFFSRSRNRLWEKGETSGNYLYVREIKTDCDSDAILITVKPFGPVCHRQTQSCFDEDTKPHWPDFLYNLEEIIHQRAAEDDPNSYTRKLLARGFDRIAQKVGEEAVEVVIASKNQDADMLKGELADLMYHLLVLMYAKGISLSDVSDVLRNRHQSRK